MQFSRVLHAAVLQKDFCSYVVFRCCSKGLIYVSAYTVSKHFVIVKSELQFLLVIAQMLVLQRT